MHKIIQLILFLILYISSIDAKNSDYKILKTISESQCTPINGLFFDLGDTLIEDNGSGMFVLRPGATDIINNLQAMNIQLGIITNVPASWNRADLEALMVEPNFLNEFEVVILSSQAPANKPNPAIFTYAYSQLTNPEAIESFAFVTENLSHIADKIINPTSGARATGMIGIHLSDIQPSSLSEYTIPTNGLNQISQIVNQPIFCNNFEI